MPDPELKLPRAASRVVFFLGAGASRFAGIPTTVEFVKEFREQLGSDDKGPISAVLAKLKSVTGAQGVESPEVDIEALMEALEKLSHPSEEMLLNFCTDSTVKPDFNHDWPRLLKELRHFVRRKCQAQLDKITYLYPIADFVRAEFNEGVIDVFTTNYDNCIEQVCRAQRLVCRDGFDPYWNPNDFDKPDTSVRLYKIHGSIDWLETENGEFVKTVMEVGEEENRLLSGEAADPLVLYPMRKWQYKEPLLENLLTLKRKLTSPDCKTVVVVGYSFRDDYIRDVFWDAARTNRELALVLIGPDSHQTYVNKLKSYPRTKSTRSPLFGRVVCLPFAAEQCLSRLMLDFTDPLWSARHSLRQLERQAIHKPNSVDWSQVLVEFARCMHVEEADRLLEQRIGVRPAPGESMDLKTLSERWVSLSLWPISPLNFFEALALRALAFEQLGLLTERQVACYDLLLYANSIRVSRLNFSVSVTGIRLVAGTFAQGDPIGVAEDLLAPLEFDKFIVLVRRLELESWDLNIGGKHRIGFSDNYRNITWRLLARLHDYFSFWKEPKTLDKYTTEVGRENAHYSEQLARLKASYHGELGGEEKYLQSLRKLVNSIDREMFDQLIRDLVEFSLRDTPMSSEVFKPDLARHS